MELSDILPVLQSALGPLSGAPEPLGGGITNRNYRATLGGQRVCDPAPGQGHRAARDRPGGGADGDRRSLPAGDRTGRRDERHGLPGDRVRRLPRARAARTSSRAWRSSARALRAFHECAVELPTRFWVPDLLQDYAAIVTDRGARGSTAGLHEAMSVAGLHTAQPLPLTRPRPCHDDLLPGNIIRAGADGQADDRRLGVRGDGPPAVSISATSRSTTTSTRRWTSACSRAYGGEAPYRRAARGAEADADPVRCTRGRMGCRAGTASRSSTSTSRTTAHRHFERLQAAVRSARLPGMALYSEVRCEGGKAT